MIGGKCMKLVFLNFFGKKLALQAEESLKKG